MNVALAMHVRQPTQGSLQDSCDFDFRELHWQTTESEHDSMRQNRANPHMYFMGTCTALVNAGCQKQKAARVNNVCMTCADGGKQCRTEATPFCLVSTTHSWALKGMRLDCVWSTSRGAHRLAQYQQRVRYEYAQQW